MIERLELKDFGAFHDTTVIFDEGYQCLQGPNESGKSTTVMCIRALLYGFSKDSATRKIYSAAYDDYMPLDGRGFSAAMDIKTSKGRFRIERNFYKENEQFKLLDLEHNRLIDDESLYTFSSIPQPGSYFWGLSQDDFLRFFLMKDLQNIDTQSLFKRIEETKNYLQSGDSRVRLNDAYLYLEKHRKEIGTIRAKKSPMGKNRENIDVLEKEIVDLRQEAREIDESRSEADRAAAELRRLKRCRSLQIEKVQLLPSIKKAIEDVAQMDEALMNNEIEINRFESKRPIGFVSNSKIGTVSAFFAVMFTFIGLMFAYLGANRFSALTLFFAAFSFLFAITVFVFRLKTKKALEQYHRRYTQRDELLAKKHDVLEWIDPFIEEDIEMEELYSVLCQYEEKLIELPDYNEDLEDEIASIQRRIGLMEGKAQASANVQKKIVETEKLYRKEKEKASALNRDLEIISMVENILKEMHSEGEARFKQEILRTGERYLSVLSDGRYNQIAFGEDTFVISGENRPSLKDTQLSTSTLDLLVLSFRLAAIEGMDPSIPMVFDDGFVYLDEYRKSRLVEVLKGLNRQILDFTTPKKKGE